MKRILIILVSMMPAFLYAGVILQKNGDRLEDVSIKSVNETEIIYITQNGEETSILKSDVSAILYDNGRYEEIRQTTSNASTDYNASTETLFIGDAKEVSLFAYGKPVLNAYVTDHEFDGAIIECRVATKDNPNAEFKYLGTTPFAYITNKEADVISGAPKLYGDAASIMQVRPFLVDKNWTKIEFRISKEGYKTVVCSPMQKVDFGGTVIFLPLNKLKKLKEGESNTEPIPVYGAAVATMVVSEPIAVEPSYSQYQDGQIHKLSSNQFYFVDSLYTKKEIQSIVIQECPEALKYYNNARKWVIGGWSGFGTSIAMVIVGGIGITIPDGLDYASLFFLLPFGCAGFVTSLTIACIGHHRINNTYKIYNKSCVAQKQPPLSLQFGATSNGLGMTLKF